MRATVTVVTAQLPGGEDVVIDAPQTASVGEVAAAIAASLGHSLAAPTLALDGPPIDSGTPLAATRVRDGATVVLTTEANATTGVPCASSAATAPPVKQESSLTLTATGDGQLRVNRPPRLHVNDPSATRQVPFPSKPQERATARLPLIATAAPLVAGLALAAVMRRPEYLLFTVLSPLMMAAQWLADRVGQRRAARADAVAYGQALSAAHQRLTEALAAELADRHTWTPDATAVADIATTPTRRLWERRRADPDFAVLRLGTGVVPTATTPSDADIGRPNLAGAPVTLNLRDVGVFGVAGTRDRTGALAASLLAQLATLHSPRDLAIVVLTNSTLAERWTWTRWLPHLRPADGTRSQALVGADAPTVAARVAELNALIAARQRAAPAAHAATDGANHHRAVVVLVDGAHELRSTPGLADVLRNGPSVAVLAICLDTDTARLPEECGAVARCSDDADGGVELSVANAPAICGVIADDVSHVAAERIARALAPLREEGPTAGATTLPDAVRWLDVVAMQNSVESLTTELSARWRTASSNTVAVLGASADGPFEIDIARDGPHALIAGTTGSGKSELLRTLVASLAAGNRPDELTFVLIDYKGGAAFGACAALPHTVGLVTDLDGSLAERALVSLTAELKRREALFAAAQATDINAYRQGGRSLARLVIVVDEFASLADELPDFVGGLVGIAQRGRSLGVHLVLATQRPEGVVSADIRANMNLRICLAVTRESESRDVIEAPDSAWISRLTPGRAHARTGHGELRAFQCARVGGAAGADNATTTARIAPFRALGHPAPVLEPPRGEARPETDLDVVVAACQRAATCLDIETPASPWLPPLPDVVPASDVNDPPLMATLGWRDLPAQQAREPYVVDLTRTGHLVIAGSARSGRTTALRALAALLARGTSTADLHLYAFDCAGGTLAAFAHLPQCGAVVAAHESDRARRLMSVLTSEVATRRAEFAAQGLASINEQRERSCAPLPHIVVFIDGWESFVASFEDVDGGRFVDAMFDLLRDGASAGVHVVASGERGGLVGRLASLVDQRLVLRLADRADFTLIGLPVRAVPESLPAGRAFSTQDLAQLQICLLSSDPSGPAQLQALTTIAVTATNRDATLSVSSRPRRVDELPAHVVLEELAHQAGRRALPRGAWVLLGVGGDQVEPQWVDLADGTGGFVIAGPPRSGRSTALSTVAASLRSTGWFTVLVTARPSPAGDWVDAAVSAHDPLVADALSAPRQPITVLVDDAERVLDTPAAGPLERFARDARDGGNLLVLAGTTDDLAVGFRGFVVEARRARRGVLLAPRGPLDGEVFGVRLPRDTGGRVPPGRGLLVEHGMATPLQMAAPRAAAVTSRQ